uniref:Uncharacterized protein n=1 Tax=Romanomermis culicivorax TaxID=13658 RepID=A0A915L6T6_ROMCU
MAFGAILLGFKDQSNRKHCKSNVNRAHNFMDDDFTSGSAMLLINRKILVNKTSINKKSENEQNFKRKPLNKIKYNVACNGSSKMQTLVTIRVLREKSNLAPTVKFIPIMLRSGGEKSEKRRTKTYKEKKDLNRSTKSGFNDG